MDLVLQLKYSILNIQLFYPNDRYPPRTRTEVAAANKARQQAALDNPIFDVEMAGGNIGHLDLESSSRGRHESGLSTPRNPGDASKHLTSIWEEEI